MFSRYFRYLRDNPDRLWFKRKLYGWGWVPVRWQGWIVVFSFIVFTLLNTAILGRSVQPNSLDVVWFVLRLIVLVAVLLFVCYKTGEKPRWQWGNHKK